MNRPALLLAGTITIALTSSSIAGELSVVEKGPNHRVLRGSASVSLPGGRVTEREAGFTEIAVGMHYEENGQWLESREEIELFQGGAIARRGPYSVIFAPNIATAGAVDLLTADGIRLRSHVLGLGLYNVANGNSTLLAETTDSIGQLHPPNIIVYPGAFDDVSADIRYTYRKGRFSQDVILRQKITLPEGFDTDSTYLEIWTEFVAPPAPEAIVSLRADGHDETLAFESMRIGPGRAFALEANGLEQSMPVVKRWLITEGRTFLVEAIRVATVNAALDRMGIQQAAIKKKGNKNMASTANTRPFPRAPKTKVSGDTQKIETALAMQPNRGLVIDYDLSGTIGTLRLQGDTTYSVTSDVTVTNLIIEGGTVVKFAELTSIMLSAGGSVTCDTDPYRPAIFTSKNDNTVGATISGSTGTPAPSGSPWQYLYLPNTTQLEHVRFSYANPAIYSDNSSITLTLKHAQLVHCSIGIWLDAAATIKLQNLLMYDIGMGITGVGWTGKGEHLTVSVCGQLTEAVSPSSLALTNSLLANVTNLGSATITTNLTIQTSGTSVLQTVGGGSAYLATNSPYRDIGTTNISALLLQDLRRLTTYPPLSITSSATYTNNLDLLPQAQRDTDALDLGYHYYPLDFVIGGVNLTNATLTASNGVAIGTRNVNGFGIGIGNAARLLSIGTPDKPNRIVRYNVVQEQATTNWATSGAELRLITGFPVSSVPSYVTTRFTHMSTHANGGENFYTDADSDTGTHYFKDSEFHNGDVFNYRPTLHLTNCLLNRAGLSIADAAESISPSVRHCTFRGGSHSFYRANGGTWTIRDNLFDAVAIPVQNAVIVHDYNAYTTNSARLTNSASRDIRLTVTNVTFQLGSLGRFYLPTNLASHWPLTNTTTFVTNYAGGSTNANLLALYHYTATTNQIKETTTIVDVGYHYVATDSNGVPLDYDGDGSPDYFEDINGNGSLDWGETGWQNANDWGLKVFITRPRNAGQ